jgi:hypothetical protein
MSTPDQPDLLAPLEPPPEDLARPIGLIEGPPGWRDGFGAGLRVWCGPLHGWREFGELLNADAGGLLWHRSRLTVGLSWDLGPAPLRRGQAGMQEAHDAAGTPGEAELDVRL